MINLYKYEIILNYYQIVLKKIARIRIQGLLDPDSIEYGSETLVARTVKLHVGTLYSR